MFDTLWQRFGQRHTAKRVRRFGWTAIYVGDYSSAPTWAYTIGLHGSLNAPEIIVFDIPMASANGLFHEIYGDLKSGKLVIRDREEWRAGEFHTPLIWRAVHPDRLYDNDPESPWLGLAEDFARIITPSSGPITAFQLVMSDPGGRLPWEPEYDEKLRPLQRELYLPREATPTAAKLQVP